MDDRTQDIRASIGRAKLSAAVWVGILLVAALIPAYIAARKQPSRRWGTFATYYLFGLLLWVAAVPVAIWVVKDERLQHDLAH